MGESRITPATAQQVFDAVQWANSAGEALEVVGRASKRALGRPVAASRLLDLSQMAGVVAYEPEELTLTARAGTALEEIKALLADRRQMLAFEPPDWGPLLGSESGQASIGGVVACNLAGPRRLTAGAVRDHFLGMQGVSGRGELFRAGGRVVKNVTGYDLCKLLAGSYGALAVLTETTLKVLPAPESTATRAVLGLSDAAAMKAMAAALGGAFEVSAAAHLPADVAARSAVPQIAASGGATLLRLEGFSPSVAARLAQLSDDPALRGDGATLNAEESAAVWREIGGVAYFVGDDPATRAVWRLSVPPSQGAAVVARLREIAKVAAYYDWGGGLIWLSAPLTADPEAIRAALPEGDGHATLIRAPEATRATADVFQPQHGALGALARRVREAFDPNRVLNPGRMRADD